jgi:hypothetical protein
LQSFAFFVQIFMYGGGRQLFALPRLSHGQRPALLIFGKLRLSQPTTVLVVEVVKYFDVLASGFVRNGKDKTNSTWRKEAHSVHRCNNNNNNVKPKVLSISTEVTGTISKPFRQCLSNIPESTTSSSYRTQPHGALQACIRYSADSTNVRMIVHNFNMGHDVTSIMNCKYRIAVKLHPRNMIYFRYGIVNTLHEAHNKQ